MRNQGRDGGPNFGNARGDQWALDEVAQSDLLLDALAVRTESAFGDSGDFDDHALAALLGDWRDDLRWPPASALVSQEEAEEALRDGMVGRRRGSRGLATVGSLAATLLMLSGFGAVVADARPGDLLYGLHAMMFNEPRVSDDQIVLSAKADLAKAEQMIAQGQWEQAQSQLAEVSSTLQAVNDGSRRQGLLDEVSQLNTKVEKRDPTATRPESPPTQELSVPVAPSAPVNPVNPLTPLAPATEPSPPAAVEPATSLEVPLPTEPTDADASNAPIPTATPPAVAVSTTPSTASTTPGTAPPTTPQTTPPSPSPSPSKTTTEPNSSSTITSTGPSTGPSNTPSTRPPQTTAPTATPSSAPTSRGNLSTTATPGATANSPAAGPSSPGPSTLSGELWDRTSGPAGPPAAPRTPFPQPPAH